MVDRVADSGWHLKAFGQAGEDISAPFQTLVLEAKAGNVSSFPASAKSFVYLMIPGLFTENYPVREQLVSFGLCCCANRIRLVLRHA